MVSSNSQDLLSFIRGEWQRSVPEAVNVAAKNIAERYGDTALGVMFYGSCLRTGEIEDKILDFYVIVDSYQAAYSKKWLAVANKMIPPNVFYHEIEVAGVTVRSKYAVLSLDDYAFRVSEKCLNVSVWARFCQPCLLLAAKNNGVADILAGYVAEAVTTMTSSLLSLKPQLRLSRDVWVEAFEQTYAAELRSERKGKGLEIYLLDQERYDALTPLVLNALGVQDDVSIGSQVKSSPFMARLKWMMRRWNGKVISFLRLIKASMTFDGGIDYLAWKIRRHSGVDIEVTDWMRRHPVLAGISLFWKLRKKGAFQ